MGTTHYTAYSQTGTRTWSEWKNFFLDMIVVAYSSHYDISLTEVYTQIGSEEFAVFTDLTLDELLHPVSS